MTGCLMVLILLFNEGTVSGTTEIKLIDETVLIQQKKATNNTLVETKVKFEKFSGEESKFEEKMEIPKKCQEFFTQRCKMSLPYKSVEENPNNFDAMKSLFVSCCKAADHQDKVCNSLMEEFPVDKKKTGTQVVEKLCVAMEAMANAHDAWLRAEKTQTSLTETSLDHTVQKKEAFDWYDIKVPRNGIWKYRLVAPQRGISGCCPNTDEPYCSSAWYDYDSCPTCSKICEDEGKKGDSRVEGTSPQCRAGDEWNKKGWCPENYRPYAISWIFKDAKNYCDNGFKACCCKI